MTYDKVDAPLDQRWWPSVAARLREFARDCQLPGRDLRALTVLVPRIADAPQLRSALQAGVGAAFIAPRITTLERWAAVRPALQSQRLVELFEALRASAWVRAAFGERPGGLWALAGELAALGDELTLAAVAGDGPFEGRWQASVQRHFRRRAAAAGSAQVQLVLQIWKAHQGDEFGAGALLRGWSRRVRDGAGPLLVLAPFELPGWQRALLGGVPSGRPLRVVQGDAASMLDERPWLRLAWPELTCPQPSAPVAPMALRGEAARAQVPPAVQILAAASLEEEAGAAASQVMQWLDAGVGRIGVVALDRLAARRVRALLERAQIVVADQSGWKLSTTSAAAAVMRWLDLVAGDFRIRDLLDWLRSPFALAGTPQRLALARLFDEQARRQALAGGLGALTRMLARLAQPSGEPVPAALTGARQVLGVLDEQARRLRAGRTAQRLSAALGASLDALGMRAALARDPVGGDVLRELERLRLQLQGRAASMSLGEFRELLVLQFENTNASDAGVDSPVVMTSLAGACLRPLDAVLLIGAGAEHLPATGEAGLIMSAAVRRDLGLATPEDAQRDQQLRLAVLLASVPHAAATWRRLEGDEPRSLSVWLDRLRELALRAGWPDPVQPARVPVRRVAPGASGRPAPALRGRLPRRLSAGACQSLVDCPYQFYARHLLGLRRRDLLDEVAGKRDLGVALHAILQRLHQMHDGRAIAQMPDAALEAVLADLTAAQFERDLKDRPTLIAYRQRILEWIPGYVAWLRARAAAGWRLQAVEADFGVPFMLADGHEVDLSGRIDRVEIDAQGILEAIDYKARTHDAVRDAAADPGEQIQLPFYALALGPDATRASYLSFQRASDPLRRRTEAVRAFAAAAPLRPWVDAVGERLREDLGRVRDGAPLPALGTEPVCTHCEMRGLCRRAEWSRA